MSVIEAQLSTIIGPVAKIICFDYVKDIQSLNNLKALNALIEKISNEILNPEQQKIFRKSVFAFINQYHLKSEAAILKALKNPNNKLRLSPESLSLCITKHEINSKLGARLSNQLSLQIELAGNLKNSAYLIDILNTLEQSNKTGLLEVRSKTKRGGFYFHNGVLFNAVESGMNGKIIAMDILQWNPDYVVFRAQPQAGATQQIHQTVNALVAEVERLHHSTLKNPITYNLSKSDEVSLTTQAIQMIKRCDNASAEQILARLLLHNDKNFKNWLWLSRILTNMTAIEISLKKAANIQVGNINLTDEVKKFSLARKSIEGDFVLRCPFCWMPIPEENSECSHCKAKFFITPDFFNNPVKANFNILDTAVERYNSVLKDDSKEPLIYLRFYLAMAYLNRKYYQEGLDQLQEIKKLAPNNTALITQHQILFDYMNFRGLTSKAILRQELLTKAELDLEPSSSKGKILVVEDSTVTRKVITRTLVANGYQVFEAKNAFEALDGLSEKNPNLILLDIILPDKDGYEILAEVRQMQIFEKLPVVMLTSRDSLFDKLKGKVSEANEYLTKPFQPDELLTVVRRYLN